MQRRSVPLWVVAEERTYGFFTLCCPCAEGEGTSPLVGILGHARVTASKANQIEGRNLVQLIRRATEKICTLGAKSICYRQSAFKYIDDSYIRNIFHAKIFCDTFRLVMLDSIAQENSVDGLGVNTCMGRSGEVRMNAFLKSQMMTCSESTTSAAGLTTPEK